MKEVEVVFENGVFKPLSPIKLKEGTRAKVILKSSHILETARKYRTKVDVDVMKQFIEERR